MQVSALQLIRRLNDVTNCVLMMNAPDLHLSVRVTINRHESVDHSHHEVAMHELEKVDFVFWLVLGSSYLYEPLGFKITQVDLNDGRMGAVFVPGQYNRGRYLLSSRVPHLEYL